MTPKLITNILSFEPSSSAACAQVSRGWNYVQKDDHKKIYQHLFANLEDFPHFAELLQQPNKPLFYKTDTDVLRELTHTIGEQLPPNILPTEPLSISFFETLHQAYQEAQDYAVKALATTLFLQDNELSIPIGDAREIREWLTSRDNLGTIELITNIDLHHAQLDVIPKELALFPNLKSLSLNNNQIVDLSPLTFLTSLQELYLNDNCIDDIAPLTSLTQLKTLALKGNLIKDLAPLTHLTQLTDLNLIYNCIDDIAPLASLALLRTLSLAYNSINNLAQLALLTNLTILDLSNNRIEDIVPLASLNPLETLDLRENPITDYSPIDFLEITYLYRDSDRLSRGK